MGRLIVVMGVSGCGKSTVGRALADHLGGPFVEGDAFHPPENRQKMVSGTPLDDDDRAVWLDGILSHIGALTAAPDVVLACSALTPYVQTRLSRVANRTVCWRLLTAPASEIAAHMAGRSHFMPVSLLESQLQALQPPDGAFTFRAYQPIDVLTAQIAASLNA